MRALILVDIQNDFMPDGSLPVPEGDEVIPVANELMGEFTSRGEPVVATRDQHPADHCSFASQHEGRNVGDRVDVDGLEQMLWPDHCIRGTDGAAFPPALDEEKIDETFPKGVEERIDAYSGFFDNGRRRSTGLEDWLRERGVDEVHIVGLATDVCVKATAIDAARLGFDTKVRLRGCRAVEMEEGDERRAIEAMREAGAEVVEPRGAASG